MFVKDVLQHFHNHGILLQCFPLLLFIHIIFIIYYKYYKTMICFGRLVLCLDNMGNLAHSGFCGPDYDLVEQIKPCISLTCNAVYWDVNDWEFCNVPCGIGTSTRQVTCRSALQIQPDSACFHLPTPSNEKICNSHVRLYLHFNVILRYIKFYFNENS